jgi:acyl carrier protein
VSETGLHAELVEAIAAWGEGTDAAAVLPDSPLITSARLDSLQLFQLLLWIEEKVGRKVDATAIDIATEWDTVERIVAFVEGQRARE